MFAVELLRGSSRDPRSVCPCACSSRPGELWTLPGDPLPWLPASSRRAGQEGQGPAACCFGGCSRQSRVLLSVSGHGGPALPCPFLAWAVSWFPLQAGGSGASPQKGLVAFWAGFRHWAGAGPGPSMPEFPGGEQEGAGPCRDCPEQGGSTQGRAGAGSIHISLLPFPEVPPAAQAAPRGAVPIPAQFGEEG